MVDFDPLDTSDDKSCCSKFAGHLSGKTALQVIDVNPVTDLQGLGASPFVESATTHDPSFREGPEYHVPSVDPILLPGTDEIFSITVTQRFGLDPWHPWSEMVDVGLDRFGENHNIGRTPLPQNQAPADNYFRKNAHSPRLPQQAQDTW